MKGRSENDRIEWLISNNMKRGMKEKRMNDWKIEDYKKQQQQKERKKK